MKLSDRMRSMRRLLLAPRISQLAQAAASRLAPLERAAARAQELALRGLGALHAWRPLRAGRPVHGKLKSTEPGLNAVFVQATKSGAPHGTVRLELTRAGATAAIASARADEAPNHPGWLAFRFPALGDSNGARYHYTLACDSDHSGVSVRVVNPTNGRIEICPGYYVADNSHPSVRARRLEFSAAKLERAVHVLVDQGPTAFTRRVVEHLVGRPVVDAQRQTAVLQSAYIARQRWTSARSAQAYAEQARWARRPLVSVLMPIDKVDAPYLSAAIASVRAQVYPEWELVAVDDASPEPYHAATRSLLDQAAAADPRVKAVYLTQHLGSAGAMNRALAEAKGDFVALLDPDDLLETAALWEIVRAIQDLDLDIVYTDEHRISADGKDVLNVFFKPDWSPDRSLSQMYASHLVALRTKLARELGGFRDGYQGSQDWDLVLRASEKTDRIHHVARSCYAWRATGPGVATAHVSARHALEDALQRRGIDGDVEEGLVAGTFRIKRRIRGKPLVSVIISFHDQTALLRTTVESVLERTTWASYELILIDNGSHEPATSRLLRQLEQDRRVSVMRDDRIAGHGALSNAAAHRARGEHLLFLAHDVEVIAPGWMEAMIEHAQRPEVGAVGARLLYPTGQVQHAGLFLGIGPVAGHASRFLPRQDPGYFAGAKLVQNLSAVSSACMMVRRPIFTSVGGFDEHNLAGAYADVDLCLRLREKGLLVVYTPYAELYHFESTARGARHEQPSEVAYMQKRWGHLLARDPYYNPNLTSRREDFSLRDQDEGAAPAAESVRARIVPS